MRQKESAPTAQGNESANKNSAKCITFSPREARALVALVHAKDWIARETIDRIARASNGPSIVQALRHKLGSHDAIEMQRMAVTDADGKTAQAGRYRLSDAGRAVATELMKEAI